MGRICLLLFLLAAFGCSSTKPQATEKLNVQIEDETLVSSRLAKLEQMRLERAGYLRLMNSSESVEELDSCRRKIRELDTQIARMEIEVPDKLPKSRETKIEVSEAEDEILTKKIARLEQMKKERETLDAMLKSAKNENELLGIKRELDSIDGEIEDLDEEIHTQELEDAGQQKFAVKQGTVYGPFGIACEILEITFKRLYILFEF